MQWKSQVVFLPRSQQGQRQFSEFFHGANGNWKVVFSDNAHERNFSNSLRHFRNMVSPPVFDTTLSMVTEQSHTLHENIWPILGKDLFDSHRQVMGSQVGMRLICPVWPIVDAQVQLSQFGQHLQISDHVSFIALRNGFAMCLPQGLKRVADKRIAN